MSYKSQIKYLDLNFEKEEEKNLKAFKTVAASSYALLLLAVPFLVSLLVALPPEPKREISSTKTSIFEEEKAQVLKNDSYWKLSKRYCGEVKYFLNIREVNGNKALFEGDTILISCR